MKRTEYFKFMAETSELVAPVMEKYVEPFKTSNKELYDILMFFIRRRLGKPLLKPTLLRLSYEVCGGTEWHKVIPAAVAFEFLNISSYQANCAFDNKLGVITRSQKDSQFIASMITRELASRAASELNSAFGAHLIGAVRDSLSKCNEYIYLAQHYDLNLLHVDNYHNYEDEKLYLKEYVDRCFYGSGIFNGQCAYIGGLLANGRRDQREALRQFGEHYGTALQMINDLGDFVPPGTDKLTRRDFQDQFSDFRNGRLTLPLYHLLRFGKSETQKKVRSFMNQMPCDRNSFMEIAFSLVSEGSVSYAKEKARELTKKAEEQLRLLENSQSRELLMVLLTIILTNKYLVAMNKVANDYGGKESPQSLRKDYVRFAN